MAQLQPMRQGLLEQAVHLEGDPMRFWQEMREVQVSPMGD